MAEFSIRQHYRLMYDEPIDLGAVQSLTKVYLPIIGCGGLPLGLMMMNNTRKNSLARVCSWLRG